MVSGTYLTCIVYFFDHELLDSTTESNIPLFWCWSNLLTKVFEEYLHMFQSENQTLIQPGGNTTDMVCY